MREFLSNLWKRQKLLILSAIVFVLLTVVLTVLLAVDSEQILGINRWIKPIKFSSSIAIYLFTLATFMYYLPGFSKSKNIIKYGSILFMIGEIVLIIMQPARGTTSHFNNSSSFDGIVYTAMGIMIFANMFLDIWLTVLYFLADIKLPNAVVWGMRLGLIVFILGSLEGGYMAQQIGHSVGSSDGGAGLPFVNWSTVVGDLRVAHFFGLHAFQAIPLFSLAISFLRKRMSFIKPTAFTVIFAALYFSFFTFFFGQALIGKPLIKQDNFTRKINKEEILR